MKLTKEELEYELVKRYFEFRDGELWVKEFESKDGRVYKARPAKCTLDDKGYIQVCAGNKRFREHRIIFILTHNRPIKEGYDIHHKYGNRADNRIENLEEVSHQVNCQNRRVHLDGKLVGVSPYKKTGKWQVHIYVNGKNHYLGDFKTPEEAHAQYRKAVRFIELNPELLPHLTPAMLRNFLNEQENPKHFLENDDIEYITNTEEIRL